MTMFGAQRYAAKRAKTSGTYWRAGRIIWQGVDHVLRSMRDPAHLWRAILHQMRQADCPEWNRVISWFGAGFEPDKQARGGACCGSGRFGWARAAQHPRSGDSVDDQRHSPADGSRLDDDFREDVYPAHAGLDGTGRRAVFRMEPGQYPFAGNFFRRDCSGALWSSPPGSSVGAFRTRAVGADAGTGAGVPGVAAFSVRHGAGDLHAVGAAAGE